MNFNHKLQIQVRFKDFDRMGHVHNANYLTYVELARLDYFKTVLGTEVEWYLQKGLILARAEIDFKSPLLPEEEIAVHTRCARLGTKSFDLRWAILRTNGAVSASQAGQVVAEGLSVLVCYDYKQQQPIAIPEDCRNKMIQFEDGSL